MKILLTTIFMIAAACHAYAADTQPAQLIESFGEPYYDGCKCSIYIPAKGGGIDGKTVFFRPCDKSFAFVKIEDHSYFLSRVSESSSKNSIEETWKNYFFEVKLSLKKSGTGAEAQWYTGSLSVKKGQQQQVIDVVGSCGI